MSILCENSFHEPDEKPGVATMGEDIGEVSRLQGLLSIDSSTHQAHPEIGGLPDYDL
jgi:hypothetical protein